MTIAPLPSFRVASATLLVFLAGGLVRAETSAAPAGANQLTAVEKADGWRLLFDGHSLAGWRNIKNEAEPSAGWEVKDGELSVTDTGGMGKRKGDDIATRELFSNFELVFDFKITSGANSGVKYFVAAGSALGLEYQVLDDARHPDAKLGAQPGSRTIASLYDLIAAPADKPVKPIGEWNQGRIIARGNHVEHWLNGRKLFEFERGSAAYRALVAASKYAKGAPFGEAAKGVILLQDHGNPVSFRNIKLREIKP